MPYTCEEILSLLNLDNSTSIQLSKESTVASLWAGYGKVTSLKVHIKDSGSESFISLIVKRVEPKDINDESVSNQRKIKSYRNEAKFYRVLSPIIQKLNEKNEVRCNIPIAYSIEDDKSSFTFLLSDLSERFHCKTLTDIQKHRQAIQFLAGFHAAFYHHHLPESTWDQGGYWHLQTRWEEWEHISDSKFKSAANAIDEFMRNDKTHHTLVHGDFKEANILFGETHCGVVDFQYAGRGYGAKDLVMWIVSSLNSHTFREVGEEGILRFYANELKKCLISIGFLSKDEIERISSLDEITKQYELALVDYVRFMLGWGMWGNSKYAMIRANEILEKIAQNWSREKIIMDIAHLTEQDWKEAIWKMYQS